MEILFKGVRLHESEVICGYPFQQNGKWFIHPHGDCDRVTIAKGDETSTCFVEIDPSTISQYTGRCDKNGNKIFSGMYYKSEVLACHPTDRWGGSYWVPVIRKVEMINGCFKGVVINEKVNAYGMEFSLCGSHDFISDSVIICNTIEEAEKS